MEKKLKEKGYNCRTRKEGGVGNKIKKKWQYWYNKEKGGAMVKPRAPRAKAKSKEQGMTTWSIMNESKSEKR
jgi:hypothetical protein